MLSEAAMRGGWLAGLLVTGPVLVGLFGGERLNGFNIQQHSIPLERIESGGPPRDGIPALLSPKFVTADRTDFLKPNDRVLGMARGTHAKAYPIKILNWHEIVNDTLDGRPVLITYCPLCGTGIAFDPVIAGRHHIFGVSGLLYNSDVLLYDRQTESLWSQILMEAVAGPRTGTRLQDVPLIHTTWARWRSLHPNTLVLSTKTGFFQDYSRDPYAGYEASRRIMFSVSTRDARFHPKEWVLGLTHDGVSRAYPFSVLARTASPVREEVGGLAVMVFFDRESRTAWATDEAGRPLPSVVGFWFAWIAFHPDTQVFEGTPQS